MIRPVESALYCTVYSHTVHYSTLHSQYILLYSTEESVLYWMLSLPARLGGLGIFDPTYMAESQYHNSIYILTPLISSLCSQDLSVPMSSILDEIRVRKREVGSNNTKNIAFNLKASLTDPSLKHCFGSHGRERCLNLAQCSAYIYKNMVLLCIREILEMPFA